MCFVQTCLYQQKERDGNSNINRDLVLLIVLVVMIQVNFIIQWSPGQDGLGEKKNIKFACFVQFCFLHGPTFIILKLKKFRLSHAYGNYCTAP